MKEIKLRIPDQKYQFFLELVSNLDLVEVEGEGDSKEEILVNLEEGFKQLKDYNDGKLQANPLKDVLNEL